MTITILGWAVDLECSLGELRLNRNTHLLTCTGLSTGASNEAVCRNKRWEWKYLKDMHLLKEETNSSAPNHQTFLSINRHTLVSKQKPYITNKMQFTSLIFAGLATAAVLPVDNIVDVVNPAHDATAPDPSTYENTAISGFSVHETLVGFTQAVQSVDSVTFQVNNNVTCTVENPDLIGKVYSCGDSAYRFGLLNGTTTDFALRIYKATGAL